MDAAYKAVRNSTPELRAGRRGRAVAQTASIARPRREGARGSDEGATRSACWCNGESCARGRDRYELRRTTSIGRRRGTGG